MSSPNSSTAPSTSPSSVGMRRRSTTSNTSNDTSTTDFLAAVATEPPREEDWKGYPRQSVAWPTPRPRSLEKSHDLPPLEKLAEAAKVLVLDSNSCEVSFESLYDGPQYLGQRRLILFVRHWYCRACQDYVRSLQDLIPTSDNAESTQAQTPTGIVLIGCGDPSLIKPYIRRTKCPYPVYTDPSLRLLKLLGCHRWGGIFWGFGKRPEYQPGTCAGQVAFRSMVDKYQSIYTDSLGRDPSQETGGVPDSDATRQASITSSLKKRVSIEGLRSGPILQVGGEFLFEEGSLVWCHRMTGMRTQATVKTLRRVLDIQEEDDSVEQAHEPKQTGQRTGRAHFGKSQPRNPENARPKAGKLAEIQCF